MDSRAKRRIKGRMRAEPPAGSGKEPGLRIGNTLLPPVFFSALLHALILGALVYLPGSFKKERAVTVYDITVTSLPGPKGGGGKSPEEVKPPKKEVRETPDKEPVKLASRLVEKKPPEPARKPEPERPEAARQEPQAPAGPGQGPVGGDGKKGVVQGPIALEGGVLFPFGFYLDTIQKKVSRNWSPPAVWGKTVPAAVISFHVDRAGRIKDALVEKTSGIELYDQMALVAVKRTSPLPPLPEGYRGDMLGVHYTFLLEK